MSCTTSCQKEHLRISVNLLRFCLVCCHFFFFFFFFVLYLFAPHPLLPVPSAFLPHTDWFKLIIKSYRFWNVGSPLISAAGLFVTRNSYNCEALAPFEDVNAWKFYFIRNKNNKNNTKMFSRLRLCGWKDWCLTFVRDITIVIGLKLYAVICWFYFLLDAVRSIITLARTPREQHLHTP